ncbi:MAG: PUR family DNA/RNA-binding protein [Aureispira sp.]|nr:PUR family DNA/RNA-binding protein [Aureispira sp.]
MGFDNKDKRFESVYSQKVKAGKRRTYFFDVRQTKGNDYYITMTESTRRFEDDGYSRHKIFLYKEDFNRFLASLTDVIDHIKTELMPDYDYEEYSRRYDKDSDEYIDYNKNNDSTTVEKNDTDDDDNDDEVSEW